MSTPTANIPASSVPAAKPTATTGNKSDATALQLGVMILVLGSSAGMLFYTKRTGSMLRSISTISEKQLHINKTDMHKFGPSTKQEAEKLRPRIDKDEFY